MIRGEGRVILWREVESAHLSHFSLCRQRQYDSKRCARRQPYVVPLSLFPWRLV